ncbi:MULTISPECIES: helix-turn-helix domain-containing protein [Listeria]|uniref:helix-turn-helix domain-containing protein n=1 Tax=Listeria TaxID=1637 RepID=UPI0011EAA8EE|nr:MULTISPECIES: helix-turn-helix transcriptional regulator [Listeria]MBC2136662.1 helix-turn-helix transcriptional regulator [Listeria innocua]MBC2140176.1 helix-turn-helix transcriptional regulator [Listeria innocua]TYV04665.1 helix-turn-helix transcriptional regulator [Listeria monocytogenes]
MTIVDRVKSLCQKRDMSLNDLEKELNFGKNSIYRWKERNPSIDKVDKVADYFNVSTDYLLSRTDNPYLDDIPQEAATIAAHIDPDATAEDMKKILEYIDFIQQKYK